MLVTNYLGFDTYSPEIESSVGLWQHMGRMDKIVELNELLSPIDTHRCQKLFYYKVG